MPPLPDLASQALDSTAEALKRAPLAVGLVLEAVLIIALLYLQIEGARTERREATEQVAVLQQQLIECHRSHR